MPTLSYYSNVENTALIILQRKGYRLWTEQEGNVYCAEKDGWDFRANDPVQLLGIVAIYETHQPATFHEYWWKIEEPWIRDTLPTHAPEFTSVMKKR